MTGLFRRKRIELIRIEHLDERQTAGFGSGTAVRRLSQRHPGAGAFGQLAKRLAYGASDHVSDAVAAKRKPFEGESKPVGVAFKRQAIQGRRRLGGRAGGGEAIQLRRVSQLIKRSVEPAFVDVHLWQAIDVALAKRTPSRVKARRRPSGSGKGHVVGQLSVQRTFDLLGLDSIGHLEGDDLPDGVDARVGSAGKPESFAISTLYEGVENDAFNGALIGLALKPSKRRTVVGKAGGEATPSNAARSVQSVSGVEEMQAVVPFLGQTAKKRGLASFGRADRSRTIFTSGRSEVVGRTRVLCLSLAQEPERGAA